MVMRTRMVHRSLALIPEPDRKMARRYGLRSLRGDPNEKFCVPEDCPDLFRVPVLPNWAPVLSNRVKPTVPRVRPLDQVALVAVIVDAVSDHVTVMLAPTIGRLS